MSVLNDVSLGNPLDLQKLSSLKEFLTPELLANIKSGAVDGFSVLDENTAQVNSTKPTVVLSLKENEFGR